MKAHFSNQQARSEASMAAARALVQLRVNTSQPIDIFKIIQDQGIWLMFQPLNNLFGVYLREGDAAGIILNSKHPLSLQRFTAAHEFGHHMLHHALSLDDDVYLERTQTGNDPREAAADTFAARFLMPLQLVNTMLVRMGLPRDPERLTSLQVYQLALDIGVSYMAAINGLVGLDKINRAGRPTFARSDPKTLRSNSAGGFWITPESTSGRWIAEAPVNRSIRESMMRSASACRRRHQQDTSGPQTAALSPT